MKKGEKRTQDQKPRLLVWGGLGLFIRNENKCQPISPSRGLVFLSKVHTEGASHGELKHSLFRTADPPPWVLFEY